MDLTTLIYSKQYDTKLTQRLLHIARGKTWPEDLIDLVGEIKAEGASDAEELAEAQETIGNLEEEVDEERTAKNEAREERDKLQKELDAANKKLAAYPQEGMCRIGGVECPCDPLSQERKQDVSPTE